jgi:hypothetical protein
MSTNPLNAARFPGEQFVRCLNCLRPLGKFNHPLLGLVLGDLSSRQAMDNPQDEPPDTYGCRGGCESLRRPPTAGGSTGSCMVTDWSCWKMTGQIDLAIARQLAGDDPH